MPFGLALWLTYISLNYPCLEHIFMIPKLFEPLKFYCISFQSLFFFFFFWNIIIFFVLVVCFLVINHYYLFNTRIYIDSKKFPYIKYYSRTSMARTPMARLPRLFRTHYWVPREKFHSCRHYYIWDNFGWFSFYIENGMFCVLIRIASMRRF